MRNVRALAAAVLLLEATLSLAPEARIASTYRASLTSSNWAGYIDSSWTFVSVEASWIQPAVVSCGATTSVASFWVGIDGYGADNRTVEQIGTDAGCMQG